jgi:hypothetical protein
MGVNTTETFEAAYSEPIAAEVGDPDMFVIADDHMSHFPFAGHEQGHLSFNIMGDGAKLAGQIMGNDLVDGNPATIQILKPLVLAGLEAAGFAIYLIDNSSP